MPGNRSFRFGTYVLVTIRTGTLVAEYLNQQQVHVFYKLKRNCKQQQQNYLKDVCQEVTVVVHITIKRFGNV